MAAVLACGENAFLSHRSAGALYGICEERNAVVEVSVRQRGKIERPGIRIRRRPSLSRQEIGTLHRIPITSPVQTMLDLATELPTKLMLRTINEADELEVIRAQEELERLFLPLARQAGLPLAQTQEIVNGFEVDFHWPDLKLVVETDGLRYHRTPSAQARDLKRDQAHTAAGYARLRFSHHQVKYEPAYVERILEETAAEL